MEVRIKMQANVTKNTFLSRKMVLFLCSKKLEFYFVTVDTGNNFFYCKKVCAFARSILHNLEWNTTIVAYWKH